MNCYSCNKPLEPVAISSMESYQLDNALWITFSGGCGMFIDPIDEDQNNNVVICHDCAHSLCATVPWIDKLLDPQESHSHRVGVDWTGHTGWDLPHAGTSTES